MLSLQEIARRAANTGPVGAHEHREAAIAVYQTGRDRCLAVLVSSYKKYIPNQIVIFLIKAKLLAKQSA